MPFGDYRASDCGVRLQTQNLSLSPMPFGDYRASDEITTTVDGAAATVSNAFRRLPRFRRWNVSRLRFWWIMSPMPFGDYRASDTD